MKIDRDLRLADAMRDDPRWLKFLAGADDPAVGAAGARWWFSKNWRRRSASRRRGWRRLAIVKSAGKKGCRCGGARAISRSGQMISDFEETSHKLDEPMRDLVAMRNGSPREESPPGRALHWRRRYGVDNLQIRTWALVARSLGVAARASAGLFCVLTTVCDCLRSDMSARSAGATAGRGRCRWGWWFSSLRRLAGGSGSAWRWNSELASCPGCIRRR